MDENKQIAWFHAQTARITNTRVFFDCYFWLISTSMSVHSVDDDVTSDDLYYLRSDCYLEGSDGFLSSPSPWANWQSLAKRGHPSGWCALNQHKLVLKKCILSEALYLRFFERVGLLSWLLVDQSLMTTLSPTTGVKLRKLLIQKTMTFVEM